MSAINRMDNPVCPASLDEATLADAEVLECPYPTYSLLREQAPVFQDPRTGIWVITRYEDLRMVCLDTERFSNHRPSNDHEKLTGNARKAYELFQEKGWVPGESLAARDDPEHKQMRSIFDAAFRPKRIKALDGEVETLAYELIDAFIDDGHCNFVKQFAVPLPLIIICRQMGAKEADIWQIKAWTDAWFRGTGFDLTEAEVIWATEMEIQAQHYFQPIFERLRREPDGTLLSDLVNTPVPGWDRTLTDNELHAEMMQDTFVGGSETTTNALSAGIMLLARNPARVGEAEGRSRQASAHLLRGGGALGKPGAGPYPHREDRHHPAWRHHSQGRGDRCPVRRWQPGPGTIQTSRRCRSRAAQRRIAPRLQLRHPLLPRGALGPPGTLLGLQGLHRQRRGLPPNARTQRPEALSELRAARAE